MSPWEKEIPCPLQPPLTFPPPLPTALSVTDRGEMLCLPPLIAKRLGPLGWGGQVRSASSEGFGSVKVFLLVLHRFWKNKALELRPENPAGLRAVGAQFAGRSGKRSLGQPFGELWWTGRGRLGPSRPQEGHGSTASVGTDPGQPARTRAGDGSVFGPESRGDRDKPCEGKGLLVSEGGCAQRASGCPRSARVGEMLTRLTPTSCSTTELPRGLQHSLLSRAQLHPSGAGPSCCVSAQRFEALGSRGERCWARRV